MQKRAIIMSLLLIAALSFVGCDLLPPGFLGHSIDGTVPAGYSCAPDTGSTNEVSGTNGSPQADAESPGEKAHDRDSGDAPARSDRPDKVDVPVSGDGAGQSDAVGDEATQDFRGEPDKDTYWIDVDVTAQLVSIMRGEEVVKTMVASTGVEGHETPLGTFEIQNRGEWFFSEKYQQGAKYWVSFKDWGVYLFHSLAMDRNQQVIPEEAAKLGQPASHGCIRLTIEDAKWIYDNVPAKTKVVIHE